MKDPIAKIKELEGYINHLIKKVMIAEKKLEDYPAMCNAITELQLRLDHAGIAPLPPELLEQYYEDLENSMND